MQVSFIHNPIQGHRLIRNIITVVLSTLTVGAGVNYVEKKTEHTVNIIAEKTVDIVVNRYIQSDSLALKDIKERLAALPDTLASASMRDSILAQMDSLDVCIDKHFAGTRQRLIRIEEKLK